MFSPNKIWSSLVCLGLLSGTSGVASAQMSVDSTSMNQFRRVEQPIGLKVGVTIGGIALIGLEVWWFLLSKSKAQQVEAHQGIQEVTITVDGGYQPNRAVVRPGEPVKINFLRQDPNSCLETVLFPAFHIAQNLALDQITSIEFTPAKSGEYEFTCGMNMFRGVVEVKES